MTGLIEIFLINLNIALGNSRLTCNFVVFYEK